MNRSFYPRLALSNIYKNRKTYFPYLITSTLTIMMYYMMNSILNNSNVKSMKSGNNICFMINVGLWVARIFAVVFLFYTNSFLIKQRKKELGLYNILGMEKRHIGKMMFFETVFTAVVSTTAGIILGIVFGKLMFLLLFKLIGASTVPGFEVPLIAVTRTLILSLAIFFAILLYNLMRIKLTKPIELVHGGQVGEKEPKTKIILTIIGVITIGVGYYFALIVKSPLSALQYFLIAVVLVIIGTYCLFVAGSIALIKILRKNKRYYYKSNHFISVSGMLYRMKQNAVGLANICILSTMVLISLATTISMYLGMEDTVKTGYPKDIVVNASFLGDMQGSVDNEVNAILDKRNLTPKDWSTNNTATIFCGNDSGSDTFSVVESQSTMLAIQNSLSACVIMNVEEFNKTNNSDYKLGDGEVLLYTDKKYNNDNIVIQSKKLSKKYRIKEKLSEIDDSFNMGQMASLFSCYLVVVKDNDEITNILSKLETEDNAPLYEMNYSICFNVDVDKQSQIDLAAELEKIKIDGVQEYASSREEMRDQFHEMYGGLLFIGIFVGTLFLMATVLIIYYKQISEGYDDKERFEIMQKVGMSKTEVKKTIKSQVLVVFFLPLIVATIHVIVSFRIIKMILAILALGNTALFTLCTLITVVVFALIYGVVFIITAKSYYRIVSTSL